MFRPQGKSCETHRLGATRAEHLNHWRAKSEPPNALKEIHHIKSCTIKLLQSGRICHRRSHINDTLSIIRPVVYNGLSQRQAAATYQVSRNTVALLLRHARTQGWLTLADLDPLDNAAFSAALEKASDPLRDTTIRMPDDEMVHQELAKPHVALKLL